MKLTITITEKNPVHTRLSVWVNGGLITNPGGICLRNEEVGRFISRLDPDEVHDGVDPRPTVVCLCGSSKFYDEFQKANYQETMAGKIVLSLGYYPHSIKQAHGENVGCTPEQKVKLDQLHLKKIEMADEILVIDVDGYQGTSTRREVAYAIERNKLIRSWESERRGEQGFWEVKDAG